MSNDPKPPLTGTGDAFGRERVDKAPRSKKADYPPPNPGITECGCSPDRTQLCWRHQLQAKLRRAMYPSPAEGAPEGVDKAPRLKKVTPETHYRTASGDYAPYPQPLRELCQLRLGHEGDHSETPDPTDPRPQLCAEWVESLCTCPEGPYFGTQPVGTRILCERCRLHVYPLGRELKPKPAASDDLFTALIATLPSNKYRVVETENGWEVYGDDTHGAFF